MSEPEHGVDPRRTVEALVDGGVLVEASGEFGVSAEFLDAVEQTRADVSDLDAEAVGEVIATTVDDSDRQARLTDVGTDDREFLARYLALSETLPSSSVETRIRTVPLLDQFQDDPPRSDGAPDGFLPVRGDRLGTLTRLFPRSVVYVWLDDCDPCETLRETFEEMGDARLAGLGLFAVYGPDHARYLHDRYDVDGGPITLFMRRDEVDSRLYGAKPHRVYEREIGRLRDSTP